MNTIIKRTDGEERFLCWECSGVVGVIELIHADKLKVVKKTKADGVCDACGHDTRYERDLPLTISRICACGIPFVTNAENPGDLCAVCAQPLTDKDNPPHLKIVE